MSFRLIAYYLPQFHTTTENDIWWGKGFTEWTNVIKAKPLFKGHRQPRIPGELGYYDLTDPDVRARQATLAKEYGIEGFCYWHYWFGHGRRALDKVFTEVVNSGRPDFPFCLAWANHDWEDKKFNSNGTKTILIKQQYPGTKDNEDHFMNLLSAFKDPRYIKIEEKPVFVIHRYWEIPNVTELIHQWNALARNDGMAGIYFVAICYHIAEFRHIMELGFDGINDTRLFAILEHENPIKKMISKLKRKILHRGNIINYDQAMQFFIGEEARIENVYPTIIPNWDHSPRSAGKEDILINDSPSHFYHHCMNAFGRISEKSDAHQIVFIKSWNEWGEGNYLEPDSDYGRLYLEQLLRAQKESTS